MLEISNLSKNFGNKTVLNNINFKLDNGIYGLLGENGAGKTTLINIITNLMKPSKGEVLYDGNNIEKLKAEYRSLLGYMPQYPVFYPSFTAEEFLRYIGAIKGIPRRMQKDRIEEILIEVNLIHERDTKIGAFSGGMRQRLGIAQAILNDPSILILDEPTAGLDPGERIRFRNLISNLSTNRIVILATHIVQDVELIANQIILLHKGKVLVQRKPSQLMDEISGKVITINPPRDKIKECMDKYIISNLSYEEGSSSLRIIMGTEAIEYEHKKVNPNLEDVFLYYIQQADKE